MELDRVKKNLETLTRDSRPLQFGPSRLAGPNATVHLLVCIALPQICEFYSLTLGAPKFQDLDVPPNLKGGGGCSGTGQAGCPTQEIRGEERKIQSERVPRYMSIQSDISPLFFFSPP